MVSCLAHVVTGLQLQLLQKEVAARQLAPAQHLAAAVLPRAWQRGARYQCLQQQEQEGQVQQVLVVSLPCL